MLTFDETTHTYTEDGRKVPGVTHILQVVGLIDFSHIPENRREAALNRGSVAHKAAELYAVGKLDESTVHPKIIPYLEAYKKFKAENVKEILGVERRLVSWKFHYAGTDDQLILTLKDKIAVIDLKSSVDFSPANDIQLAAYMNLEKEAGTKPTERITVLLNDDGSYKIFPPKNSFAHDFNVFIATLSIANWRERNV